MSLLQIKKATHPQDSSMRTLQRIMGRKLGLTSLFSRTNGDHSRASSPWPWPSCNHPRTHSFRAKVEESAGSSGSFEFVSGDCMELASAVRRASSDRLLFEPGGRMRSILEEVMPFDGGVTVVMESDDPRRDFRVSMEEMLVDGGGGWDMGRLLGWFLRANEKKLHGVVVGAFLDLLAAGLASSSSSSLSASTCFSSTSSSAFEIEEVKEEE